ncbi:MAG: TetR/AcrR family transcriptional regulator [Lachnospiraceae bacterium]|jgi:AcrR family transcriptional regulator|nr:TetR/AcrR family transcriptional regulator [Lachnospiraceae bacterium]
MQGSSSLFQLLDAISDATGRRLMEALTELMEECPLDRIPTSAILKRAGVSRSTFYRRYRDKYDLLNASYQELLNRTLFQVSEGNSYKKAFFSLYSVLRSSPAFFKNAFSSEDQNNLRSYIYKQSYDVYKDIMSTHGMDMEQPYNRLLLAGYITGSLEVTCIWVKGGMKESLDTLFKLSYQLMPDEIRTCISLYYM